jgi:AmmeMemoRadiSam system protein A
MGKKEQLDDMSENLEIHCGVFVSLYVNGELRGCIGTFSEEEPLYRNVRQMAISAASTDRRFSPISPEELDHLKIEVSVLSPRTLIRNTKEIELGKHGIYIIKGPYRGTFLPQVAIHNDWTVEEFLGNCCKYKMGIGWDEWKSADIYTYEALVFES